MDLVCLQGDVVWTLYVYRWCGPCKMLGPRLEMIVAAEKGRVVMAKVDIDENVEIAMRYNVSSLVKCISIVSRLHGRFQTHFNARWSYCA